MLSKSSTNFLRVFGQTANAHPQQAPLHLRRIVRQLVATRRLVVGQLQPVQCRRTRQCDATVLWVEPVPPQWIDLLAGRRQERIAPQSLMIIEILVAQRQPVDALRQQLLRRVINETPVTPVRKTPSQCLGHTKARVDLPKQQHPAITRQRTTGKIGHHFSRTEVLKLERSLLTLC